MNQITSTLAPITNDIHNSVEFIAEKLEYFSRPFPQKIVEAAVKYKNEITPKLLEFLNYAYHNHRTLDPNYMGHLYALFLLAEFKETKAFEVALSMLELPEDSLELLLGDCLTENYPNILASLYDGNLESIKRIIENPNIYLFARDTALRSLLGLIVNSKLELSEAIQYMGILLDKEIFRNNPEAMGFLITTITDLHPIETTLQDKIKDIFALGLVDDSIIDINDFNRAVLQESNAPTLNQQYGSIQSTVDSMSWWHCFKEERKIKAPAVSRVKIGRNDPCPCGSGKKYKKCCLLTN